MGPLRTVNGTSWAGALAAACGGLWGAGRRARLLLQRRLLLRPQLRLLLRPQLRPRPRLVLCLLVLLAPLAPAVAGLPDAYGAMVLHGGPAAVAGTDPAEAEFDLRPALAKARSEHKRLYIYLGARDCPYCRRYEAFLAKHAQALVPEFAQRRYLLVDLRSALLYQAGQLFFRTGPQRQGYVEFMRGLGDERARMLVYPSVWLLGEDGRPLMQMPAGTGTFETVAEQLEILDLVQ